MAEQQYENEIDIWVSIHRCIAELVEEDLQPYPGMDPGLAHSLAGRLGPELENGACRRYFERATPVEVDSSVSEDERTRYIEHRLDLMREFILYLESLEEGDVGRGWLVIAQHGWK